MALHELQMPTIMLWPNVDAGSEDVSRGMRKFREQLQARVHPLLQELSGRDLPAADEERRVPGRQLERVDSRGRVPRHAGGQHRQPAGRPRARRRTSSTSAHDRAAIAECDSAPARARTVSAGAPLRRRARRVAQDRRRRWRARRCSVQKRIQVPDGRPRRHSGARRLEGDSAQEPCAARRAGRCSRTPPMPRVASRRLTRVVVSTDDEEIASVAQAARRRGARSCGPRARR